MYLRVAWDQKVLKFEPKYQVSSRCDGESYGEKVLLHCNETFVKADSRLDSEASPLLKIFFIPKSLIFYDETLKETAQDYGFPSQIAAPYVFRDSIVNPHKKQLTKLRRCDS